MCKEREEYEPTKIEQLERDLKKVLIQLYAKESAKYVEERGEPEALAAMYPQNYDEMPEEWADGEAGMLSRETWQRADHYAAVYSFQKKAAGLRSAEPYKSVSYDGEAGDLIERTEALGFTKEGTKDLINLLKSLENDSSNLVDDAGDWAPLVRMPDTDDLTWAIIRLAAQYGVQACNHFGIEFREAYGNDTGLWDLAKWSQAQAEELMKTIRRHVRFDFEEWNMFRSVKD